MAKNSGSPMVGKGTGSSTNDSGSQSTPPDQPESGSAESIISAAFSKFSSNPNQGYDPNSVTAE